MENKMNLVIDVGNTRFKYAFFDEGKLICKGYEVQEMYDKLQACPDSGKNLAIFLSGSGKIDVRMRNRLRKAAAFWLEVNENICLPLHIDYATPETLGFDRVAICAGAKKLFPGKELLVIDSGTAFTYNYVSKEGIFMGGNISPGQEIRFRSLHLFTEKLPYIQATAGYGGCGKTTHDAILNGVMRGIIWEVKGYTEEFFQAHKEGQVVVTGGNSLFLKNKLSGQVYFEADLGFWGLYDILEYNKKIN